MMVLTESDTKGIDALTGRQDDNVPLQPLIHDELMRDMADQFPVVPIDLSFDEEPWEQMQELSRAATPLPAILAELAMKLHGDGEDLPRFMARQRELADVELAWIKEAEYAAGGAESVDGGGPGEAPWIAPVAASGGGGNLSGGPQDGDSMGPGKEAAQQTNTRGASKVPRRRRPGKAGK